MVTVTNDILRVRRNYFIKKVKAPLVRGVTNLGRGSGLVSKILLLIDLWRIVSSVLEYPFPTKDNTGKRMSHILLDTFEEFEQHNIVKPVFFRAIKRFVVSTVEHDSDEAQRVTWFLKKLIPKYENKEWPNLSPYYPSAGWTEPAVIEAQKKVVRELLKDRKLHSCGFLAIS